MKKIILLSAAIFLTACSEEVKPVDYYIENLDEAEAVISKCEVTQGSKDDQNCINAGSALSHCFIFNCSDD